MAGKRLFYLKKGKRRSVNAVCRKSHARRQLRAQKNGSGCGEQPDPGGQ